MKRIIVFSRIAICLMFISATNTFSQTTILDETFDTDGKVTTSIGLFNDVATEIIMQPDGKILVAGTREENFGGSQHDFAIARYKADGIIDSTFGVNGIVITDFITSDDSLTSLILQSDGKILAAGKTNLSSKDIAIARYNPDGTLDISFDGDGLIVTDFGYDEAANSIALQADGKIIVAGYLSDGVTIDFLVARFNTDGSIDLTFSVDGFTQTDFGQNDFANAVAIQSDGKIVVAGSASTSAGTSIDIAISRYEVNGTLDSGFGTSGKTVTPFVVPTIANAMKIQTDGKIVIVATLFDGTDSYLVIGRYLTNGTLDNSFDSNGLIINDFGYAKCSGNSLELQSDGKIIAVGHTWTGSQNEFAVARYLTNGAPDPEFDSDGTFSNSFNTNNSVAYSVTIQSDGKIVVAGKNQSDAGDDEFAIARYNGCEESTTLSQSFCETIEINGDVFDSTGIYVQTFTNTLGCDSNLVLILTKNNSPNLTVTQSGGTLSADSLGVWFQWLDCDNAYAEIPGAFYIDFTPIADGNYAVIVTNLFCSDTSACFNITGVGLDKINLENQFSITPNPSAGNFAIQSKNEVTNASIKISDLSGKLIYYQENLAGTNFQIDLSNQPAGIYFLELIEEGVIHRIKVVKH